MTLTVGPDEAGKTIREYLRRDLGYSSGMLKRLKFMPGGITINGKFVTVRYVLQIGDVLRLLDEDREEDTCPYMIPVDLPLPIVYEDSTVTVVDKPPAMPAHPSHGHRLDTVANALAFRYCDTPYVFRPVNRLDRDTSGLMLTANTRLAASKLYQSMICGKIHKIYVAILDGVLPVEEGEIRIPMGRCEDSIVKRRAMPEGGDGAKETCTAYRTIWKKEALSASVVLAIPVTGRTHQLRVHFAASGCPCVGDTMYGMPSNQIDRHALHAVYLTFPHPKTGQAVTLFSNLPPDMAALCPLSPAQLRQAIEEMAEKYYRR